MELRREEFPLALQAYELRGEKEDFVAEQVVNTQSEADTFMSMYAGRLIKTREVRPVETKHYTVHNKKRNSALPWVILLILVVVLLVVGFATGWVQTMIGQTK